MENNWKLHHVGVAIKDADKTLEYYQSLGIATPVSEMFFKSTDFADFKLNGKPYDSLATAKIRFVQVGPIHFELVQPVEGESPQKEFIASRGEGVNHIAFTVDDLDRETAKLVEKGVPIIITGRQQDGTGFAYFDTRKVGNIIIELIQQ